MKEIWAALKFTTLATALLRSLILCLSSLARSLGLSLSLTRTHLAGENQTEEDGYGELAVAEEDDVEQVRVGRVLQEEPAKKERATRIRTGKAVM